MPLPWFDDWQRAFWLHLKVTEVYRLQGHFILFISKGFHEFFALFF